MKKLLFLMLIGFSFLLIGCETDEIEEITETPTSEINPSDNEDSVVDKSEDGSNPDLNDDSEPEIVEEVLGTRPPIYQGMTLQGEEEPVVRALFNRVASLIPMFWFPNESATADVDYFSDPNEDIMIHVKFFNPDGQSILRLTLNDVVYQTFQFQDGSDSETIIIKLNSGAEPGIRDITIDEIKYVENNTNQIKDAIFDGQRTIRFGVTHQDIPEVDILDSTIDLNTLSLELLIEDTMALINLDEQPILFELFNNGERVKEKELTLGSQTINIENLKFNSDYTYKISAVFDRIDGLGLSQVTLIEDSIKTAQILEIAEINPSHTSVNIEIDTMADTLSSTPPGISLYLGEDLIQAMDLGDIVKFDELLSDTLYTVRLSYEYLLEDEVVELTIEDAFSTLAYIPPRLENIQLDISQTSVEVEFETNDPNDLTLNTVIEVYENQEKVNSEVSSSLISGLLANTNYTLQITLNYDLNDGKGMQSSLFKESFTTNSYASPSVSISNVVSLREGVQFALNVSDPNQLGEIKKLEIISEGEVFKLVTAASILDEGQTVLTLEELSAFDGKEGRKAYIAVDGIVYDVTASPRWKDGIHNNDSSIRAGNDLTREINEISPHGKRVLDGVPIVGVLGTNILKTISNLNSNQEYILKVTYEYDLKDGEEPQLIILESTFETLSSKTPILNISVSSISFHQVNVGISVLDEDNLGRIKTIRVFDGEALLKNLPNTPSQMVTELLADRNYTLEVIYEFDLNEGNGLETVSQSYNFKTLAYQPPQVSFSAVNVSQSMISWSLSTVDPDQLIEEFKVELYLGSQRLNSVENLTNGIFEDLQSGSNYELRIVYQYNLKDGRDSRVVSISNQITTLQKAVPNITVLDTQITTTELTLDLNFNDPDSIGTVSAIRLKHNQEIVNELSVFSEVTFEDLLSNTRYTLEIDVSYQFNEGDDVLSRTQTLYFETLAKTIPTIEAENIEPQKSSINFDLVINDPDEIGNLSQVEVFISLSPVAVFNNLDDFNDYELDPDTTYRIRLTYEYDLNDGSDPQTKVHQFIRKTLLMNGSGTEEDPYQIENAIDLRNIEGAMSAHYILMYDIYLDSSNWAPIHVHRSSFSGTLDGQGYVIHGLTSHQNLDHEPSAFGLFRTINQGTVRNLIISGASVNISLITTDHVNPNIGLLSSQIFDALIEDIHVSGEIIFNATGGLIQHVGPSIGGVFGTTSRSDIRRVSSNIYIDANVKGTAYSHINVGGIVGTHFSSTLEDALVFGSLKGHSAGATARVGGIVGHTYSVIINAYADVTVTAHVSISQSNSAARGGLIFGNGDTNSNTFDSVGRGTVHIITATEGFSAGMSQGLLGSNGGSIHNSYHAPDTVITRNGDVVALRATYTPEIDEITESWLINELNFNPEIWDLSAFDSDQFIKLIFD